MELKINDLAPLFDSISDGGTKFSLSDIIGNSNIILYFYPKDFTLGCTKEACSFRDNWSKVMSMGAIVVGVSSDSPETHANFKKQHRLPFILVSDQNRSIRKLYGVDSSFLPPRATFVIDKQGKIRNIFNSQLSISKHVEQALQVLEKLSSTEVTA